MAMTYQGISILNLSHIGEGKHVYVLQMCCITCLRRAGNFSFIFCQQIDLVFLFQVLELRRNWSRAWSRAHAWF